MKNFTYRSLDEKDNIEAVLRQRKKKVNRQQIIAAVIIFIICAVGALYVIDKTFYTEYDGYMHIDMNKVRAPYDIYLDSVYVHPGDVVHIGDTLYSYYVLDWLVLEVNPNDEASILSAGRNLKLQYSDVLQKISVLQVRIAELKKQISLEGHNISFGLTDNSHKFDLERELHECEAQLRALRAQLATIAKLLHEAEFGPRGSSRSRKGGSQIYENPYSRSEAYDIRYNISNKDGFIANVYSPMGMIFFEKEEIIDMQHLDLKDNNLQVVAYVPIDKTSKIKDNMKAMVYVNDELSFDAHVIMTGVRSEDVPENLRSYFSRANKALIAILSIDEGQIIPFWSATSGLPVKVKTRNLLPWEDEPVAHRVMQYEVGKGLILKGYDSRTGGQAAEDAEEQRRRRAAAERADSLRRIEMEGHHHDKPVPAPKPQPAKADETKKADKPKEANKPDQPNQPNKSNQTNQSNKPDKPNKPNQANQPNSANKPNEANKAAAKPQQSAAPRPAAGGRYMVVCAVADTENNANIAADELKAGGEAAAGSILRSGKWYVFASRFDNPDDANKAASSVRKNLKKYRKAWVLDTNKPEKR